MRIQEIERLTGLTRKAIRFYEAKGLVSVCRSDNSYRTYDNETLDRLRVIAQLRRAGISVSSIQLWRDGVITAAEMLHERLGELRSADAVSSGQRSLCKQLLSGLQDGKIVCSDSFADAPACDDEQTAVTPDGGSPLCLGIDIGTTTLSAALIDITARRQVEAYTLASDSAVPGRPFEHMQDAQRIAERILRLLDSLTARYPTIAAIGISAQMHGIVYTDGSGSALPLRGGDRPLLLTWQDERAGQLCGDVSCSEQLGRSCGRSVPVGYGLATHYYNMRSKLVPDEAAHFCSIGDYIAMRLCGRAEPLVHASMAASFGLFDAAAGQFDHAAIARVDGLGALLPEVSGECCIVGHYCNIPVSIAVGDNQASFAGSVRDAEHSALANFGTGSQISLVTAGSAAGSLELRPYLDGRRLFCGSALCGGRAYALLERFFRSFCDTDMQQYERMNRLALDALADEHLRVRTTFCGTRTNPTLRGLIDGIGENNFTPGALILGVLYGMAEELHDMYAEMDRLRPESHPIDTLIASGNAVRKNPALREVLSRVFGMNVLIPRHTEEAAYGAALIAARAAGLASPKELADCISYDEH